VTQHLSLDDILSALGIELFAAGEALRVIGRQLQNRYSCLP